MRKSAHRQDAQPLDRPMTTRGFPDRESVVAAANCRDVHQSWVMHAPARQREPLCSGLGVGYLPGRGRGS